MAGRAVKNIVAVMLLSILSASAMAAPTASQKAEIQALGELISKAGSLFKEKKYSECGEIVAQAQQKIEKLSATGDAVILKQLETPHKQLSKAHELLELEGIELAPLMPLGEAKKPEK